MSDGLIGPRSGAAARLRPFLGRRQHGPRGFGVLGLEEAEHGRVVAVPLVVQAIVDRPDPAGDPAAAPGEEELDVGMREERVLRRLQALVLRQAQRRNPVRIAGVAVVGVVDESAELGTAADGSNDNRL